MDASASASMPEKTPVDPGCLPAWKMDEMPAPVPFGFKNILALLGPGLVMIGSTVGTGEWVVGAGVAALYRGAYLWVAPLAILCQVMLNTEVMRYTLATGEPMFTGFMRSKPGPKFWLTWYLFLDCLSWMPALAGLSAQILLFAITRDDTPSAQATAYVACAILLLCGLMLCFGGKIYNTLEVVLGGKVLFVLFYLLFATVVFVPLSVWGEIVGGMFNPFKAPPAHLASEGIQWNLVGAVAGFAGIGGFGNILASNYVREKGWGMGSKVGAIGSAFGGEEVTLDNIGTMARPSEESISRFHRWFTYIKFDQFGLWAWGSVIGMMLPCVLGAYAIRDSYFGKNVGGLKEAATLAIDFGERHGEIFLLLTLLCGFIIMFPGQFSSMDGIARRWSDAFWSGTARARAAAPHKAKWLYYSFVAAYVTAGIIITLTGISPGKMMVFNANLANLAITCCILHTLYVNSRFLPKAFQPSLFKKVCLVGAAVFYSTVFFLSAQQTIEKLKKDPIVSQPQPIVVAHKP